MKPILTADDAVEALAHINASVPRLLTPDEVAERLRIRKRTVLRWARTGRLPAVRPTCRLIRFSESAVAHALEQPTPAA